MKKFVLLSVIILALGLSLTALGDEDIVRGTGTIVYLDLEGGFYGIVADDGERYDPINLPPEFERDGLRVIFEGKIRDDLVGFHMWGTYIELTYIEKLPHR